jgi:mono/diheme cytochrome c family protein
MRSVWSVLVIVIATPSQIAVAQGRSDTLGVSQTEYQGWKVYHVNCDRCHGVDAIGSSFAPNLRRSVSPDGGVDHTAFVRDVEDGIPDKGMPAWKGNLTPEQIDAIWAYLKARSTGGLAPGRPHVSRKLD